MIWSASADSQRRVVAVAALPALDMFSRAKWFMLMPQTTDETMPE